MIIMAYLLRLLSSLFNAVFILARRWERWTLRREAERLAGAGLAIKEAAHVLKVAEIVAERRPEDDAARRLRDGSF
jgi:hypothetical protein